MWYDAIVITISEAMAAVRGHLPSIVTAALLVLAGWALAFVGRAVARRLTGRVLDRLGASSSSIGRAVDASGARDSTPGIVAGFVFWLILLVFLAGAVETLGLPLVSDLLGRLATYAPNLLAAALLVIAGLIGARVVRAAVRRAAEAGGVPQASGIAAVAESVVLILAAVIALEQLGVNGRVLEVTVGVVVGSGLAAVALAFGLGARGSVSNLIAAHYVARLIRVGQQVEIGGLRGRVVELTATAVVLETAGGRVVVPAQRFDVEPTTLVSDEG